MQAFFHRRIARLDKIWNRNGKHQRDEKNRLGDADITCNQSRDGQSFSGKAAAGLADSGNGFMSANDARNGRQNGEAH